MKRMYLYVNVLTGVIILIKKIINMKKLCAK